MVKKKLVEEVAELTPEGKAKLYEKMVEGKLLATRDMYDYWKETTPSYIHETGTRVNIGSLENAIVERVLENGYFYLVSYLGKKATGREENVFFWPKVKAVNDEKTSLIKNSDIMIRYSNRCITSLLNFVYAEGVDFEAEYQREYVWSLEDKQCLIQSIFNNVDIGKFTFIDNGHMNKKEVLDGKQRLSTLIDFYEERFTYEGKYFSDLSYRDQDHFENYQVSIGETHNITREQKTRYFLILNTTGKVMDKEHLKKVEKLLEEISAYR